MIISCFLVEGVILPSEAPKTVQLIIMFVYWEEFYNFSGGVIFRSYG